MPPSRGTTVPGTVVWPMTMWETPKAASRAVDVLAMSARPARGPGRGTTTARPMPTKWTALRVDEAQFIRAILLVDLSIDRPTMAGEMPPWTNR